MFKVKNTYFRFLLGTVTIATVAISWLSSKNNVKAQAFDIVNDAKASINEELEERHKPYFICKKYKFNDDELISTTTKSHYRDYRKAPSFKEVTYGEGATNRTVTFVYRSSKKNEMVQLDKKGLNKTHHTLTA